MANLDQINEDNINFSISDQLFFDTLLNNKIVAAFRGMHVSPAKHIALESVTEKCDRRTDGQTDRLTDGRSDIINP